MIGTLLGISIGYTVYLEAFEELGYDFVIPWVEIVLVGIGAFLATLLSVYPAARGASNISGRGAEVRVRASIYLPSRGGYFRTAGSSHQT